MSYSKLLLISDSNHKTKFLPRIARIQEVAGFQGWLSNSATSPRTQMTLSNYLHSHSAHQFSFLIFKRCHVIHGIACRQDNMCFPRSLSTDHQHCLELQYLSMPEPVTSEDSRRQKQRLTPKRFCLRLRDLWRPSLSHLGSGPPLNKTRVLATGKMLQKGWSGEWVGYIIFYRSHLGASSTEF